MKLKQTLLTLALGFGLGFSLSLTSCSDNDLNNGGGDGNNGSNTELTDKEWEKQISLQRLMGALASVDSLPDNWNSDKYIVSEPTIGQAADEATASSVRLVATTSVDEAYREYCSYVGKSNSGSATTDTWQMDGIGSLTFTPNNQTDLYATVKVNIQQLPTLQEIRFVPASVIGNNDGTNEEYYYSFGDVIEIDKNYWVCVRPANKSMGLKETHWCTFQLDNNENFKSVENTLTLPTSLGKIEDKNQRMVLNFFNLLRIINEPKNFVDLAQFDKINTNVFTSEHVAKLNNLWRRKDIWDKIVPHYYANTFEQVDDKYVNKVQNFLNRFIGNTMFTPCVLYYGYTGKYSLFKSNTYKVYLLQLALNFNNDKLFSSSVTTPTVEWNNNETKDFSNLCFRPEESSNGDLIEGYKNLFVVKYRTGAQLQGRLFKDANDNKPTESFQTSAPGKNIHDIFVYKNEKNYGSEPGNEGFTPYFTFGDTELDGLNFENGEVHTCIKPANNMYGIAVNDANYSDEALFISNITQPKSFTHSGLKVTDKQAVYITFQLLRAFAYNLNPSIWICPWNDIAKNNAMKNADTEVLNSIWSTLSANNAIYNYKKESDDYGEYYSISVNFNTESSFINQFTKKVDQATVYTIKYYPKSPGTIYYTKKTAPSNDAHCKDFVPVFSYADVNSAQDGYGSSPSKFAGDEIREFYKQRTQEVYNLKFQPE